MEEDFRAS